MIKCPICGGPARIVHEGEDYVAVKCVTGHWNKFRKWEVTYHKLTHPIILIDKEDLSEFVTGGVTT